MTSSSFRSLPGARARRTLSFAALLVCAALIEAPVAALVYVLPTDESMVSRSPVIVFGQVREARPGPPGGRPSTDFVFDIEEVLKGPADPRTITVRLPGGVAGPGIAMRIIGLPMPVPGDRMLLFLEPASDAYRPVELSLGMFFEVGTADRLLLVRDSTRQHEVPLPADAEQAGRDRHRLPRDAAAFRRWIADRAAGIERPADYFVARLPERPQRVASPYNLTRTQVVCFFDGLPVRWRNFDRGESVGMTVTSRAQSGVPGGGMTEVLAAMRAWNDDPESRVDLVRDGTSSRNFEINRVDGVNSITYDDPHDEIAGTYTPGGILSLNSVFFNCGASTPPHAIPGRSSVEALELVESNITTQDGYSRWLQTTPDPRKSHEQIMGHELGHTLGIAHSCGDIATGPCRPGSEFDQALMRTGPHEDGRGAVLNIDDRLAVRFLYPLHDGADPEPDPDPDPEPDPDPDPEPDPDPDPGPDPDPNPNPTPKGEYSPCSPTATSLRFDGGFEVGLCYETPAGLIGWGRPGIWASNQAGLLWFFSKDNAEVLVKVLDGCRFNGHYWVFVAPVTTLAFNLEIRAAGGRVWTQRNRQGHTAAAKSDNLAFECN